MSHRSVSLVSTLVAATFALSPLAFASDRTIDEHFTVKEGGKLYLRTDAGSIDIETHNEATIHMVVEIEGKKSDDFEVTYEEEDGNLSVYGERDGGGNWGWGNNLKVDFTLMVPKDYEVELNTSGGSISVEDLNGDVEADTSGGSITLGNINGDVDVRTSGGSIHTEEVNGNIDAHTSGGSVHVEFAQQITEDAELSTSGGSITAILPEDIKLDINASTSGGRVKTDFDVDGKVKKHVVKGEINGGGPMLELSTSGGNVRIKSR